jgi:TonB family protein
MMNVVKRALPFLITLIIGVFLGSLFKSAVTRYELKAGGYSYSNGSGYRGGRCPQHKYSRDYLREERTSEATSPMILFKPAPTYTDAARQNGFEGTVKLLVEYRANGKVGEIKVLEEQPYGLTEEAIEAASGIIFNPAMKDGETVTVTKEEEFHFPITAKSR